MTESVIERTLKDMEYKDKCCFEILDSGKYKGIEYYIINFGTHPCAYVNSPITIHDGEINVHGGITYHEGHLLIGKNNKISGNFIGWDYAHYGDYYCVNEIVKNFGIKDDWGKKWTTEEILNDVMNVIGQIKDIQNKG